MNIPDLDLPHFAKEIGVTVDRLDGQRPVLALDYRADLCGNPGMFHGGVVAAVLEWASLAAIKEDLRAKNSTACAVPVNCTVTYLRPATERRTYASARIVRAGRRLANLQATLWQDSEDKPVATAMVNLELSQA